MEVSLNLLNKYVKIDDQDPKELADKITSIGLEVEGMHSLANGNNMTIGYVKECIDHPDSDHLHVCQVEVRPGEVTQIVCGAPNVAAGQKVIVANPGCDLGEGFVIKQSTIRGQESNGMICSMAELGLDQRLLSPEDKDGIHVLDENAPVGKDPLEYLGLKDTILDIGLTPNRADCMALTSLAYEVAAVLKRDVNLPEIKEKGMPGSSIEVKVETELCPFFGAKLVKGVTTKESPAWLKTALLASGIKPINNIVDISNYVMLETGQPIHMYDYDKLTKKELNQVFWRSFGLEWSWNYERQMNMSYCYSMLPVIKKLYPNKEDQVAAMKRHLEFFNTTPQLATLILGISAAMEESNANDPEFDTESINSVKVSLMGPLAGIGDSFIWGTLRIIATGVGLSLANQGNILGPILFLLIFNLPAQGLRYYLMNAGYKLGSGFLAKIQQNGLMAKLTYAASVLGLMVVGGMTAENVSISFPLKFGSGNEATTLNDVFNNIMPGLMPLLFTLLVYYLLKKKNVKTTTLLLICVVIGLVGAFFGILGC